MNTYTDFYNLVIEGYHRVIEFKINQLKWNDFKIKLALMNDDREKLSVINQECTSVKINTPTYGGRYPNGRKA